VSSRSSSSLYQSQQNIEKYGRKDKGVSKQ
jgi:hypothetical protein